MQASGTLAQPDRNRRRRLTVYGVALATLLPVLSIGLLAKEFFRLQADARIDAMLLIDGVGKQLQDRLFLVAVELDALARSRDPQSLAAVAAAQTIPLLNLRVEQGAPAGAVARKAGLWLGPPVREQSSWRAPVGRPLGDGRWLRAELNASLFTQVVSNYSLPAGELLAVLHRDGELLARSVDSDRYIGRKRPGMPIVADPVYAAASGSVTRPGFDGVERLSFYRRHADLPLVVEISLPRFAVLAQWAPFAILTLALSLLIAAGWWWVLKGFDRQQLHQHGLILELEQSRQRQGAAEAQYRFLFEHNPLPMWVFDLETLRFLAVNEAMVRHYGYERERLLSMTLLDIRPAGDAEATRAAVQAASDQQTIGTIWTHLRADGTPLRMATHSHDIEFERRAARLVAAEDVTERERTEQRFRLIARATSDAIWDWDVITGELWWSDSVYTQFGYRAEDLAPTLAGWEALIHQDDVHRVVSQLERAAASDRLEWQDSYRFRRKDGSYADVLDRGFFLRDAQGHALRAAGGMLDLTQTLRDQSELRLLLRAVESTANGIVIADARELDHPVVYVNRGFEEITGYAAAQMLGTNCRMLQREDTAQPGLETLRRALHAGSEAQVLLRNYRSDGTLFYNEFYLAPVRDEQGTLTHFIGVINDVTQRQHFEDQLAHRATHDELTGLPNRQLLHDRLHQALLNANRYERQAGVIFIDLDDFKLVNDNLGHSAGDEVLRIVAQRLRLAVRDTDTVGRFGGDEFVVVVTEQTDEAGMVRVIDRITTALSQPMDLDGLSHTLTPSIGWCRYPESGTDAETLLMHADVAMYQAKRHGRNRAVAYRPEFDAHASHRLRVLGELREALHLEQFELEFQPLFARTGETMGLEALVRWRHPERGLLAPAEFIDICEESGLIVELGRRVLMEAARHHRLLAEAGLGHLRIAVNVSPTQFEHGLADHVRAALDAHAMPASVLELELTETVIMDNFGCAIEVMQELAALGVTFSVDDFGTGHSSLAYLQRLPIQRLKIDRSFVTDLGTESDDATICAAIIGLAHSLKLETVAEGVETQRQLEWLQEKGCDELQGYLLGRPAPFDLMLAQLVKNNGTMPTR